MLVENDPAVNEMPDQGVGHGGRLLGDLFEHEVLEAALLGGRQIPVDVKSAGVRGVLVAVEVGDPVAVSREDDSLVLAELDRIAGVRDERRHIGADEHLAVADPEHQRRRATSGDDHAGLVGVGEDQREVALEPAQHGQHRRGEITCGLAVPVFPGDQVDRDLGVGIAGELHAGQLELLAQGRVVLDDAVVDDGELAGGVAVRVGVAVGGASVGGPPGVPQARGAGQRPFGR